MSLALGPVAFPVFITVARKIVFSLTRPGTFIVPEDGAESRGQDWREGSPGELLGRQKSDLP